MTEVSDPMEVDLMNIDETKQFDEIHVNDFKDNRQIRIAAHSHITGLGLDETGKPISGKCGLIGQDEAREACGILVELIKQKKMSGKAILFAGPPGTGKTALAMAIAKELGEKVPFCPIVASEVYSSEVKKTEMLMEGIRKSIAIKMVDRVKYYEGEVTEITPIEDTTAATAYGKVFKYITINLRSTAGWKKLQIDNELSTAGWKKLQIDNELYDSILKQNIEVGDVIYIDTSNGIVKRKGRCEAYRPDYDIEQDTYVPLPVGNVDKFNDEVRYVTLHSMDQSNAAPRGTRDGGLSGFLQRALKQKKTEITERLREEVNKVVNSYIENGKAELYPGVLFIDEVHMLDMECFTFLHRALESTVSPIIIFATNRGMTPLRNSDEVVALGMPPDILDRVLTVFLRCYNDKEIKSIVSIRASAEGVSLTAAALQKLAKKGGETSLRYVMQLLTPCKLMNTGNGPVDVNVVDQVMDLFIDGQKSGKLALEAQKKKEVST
uniref:RuvB-like helicase n=1 Tax=Panagrolaimus sp. JU765 TaxID=591449 RepID=A0AC34RIE0_9BILA